MEEEGMTLSDYYAGKRHIKAGPTGDHSAAASRPQSVSG